jgi:hypothetical protein
VIARIKTGNEETYTLGKDERWTGTDSTISNALNELFAPRDYTGAQYPSTHRAAVHDAAETIGGTITWGDDLQPLSIDDEGTIN